MFRKQSYAAFERDPNTFSIIDLCNPSTFSPAPVAAGFILTLVDLCDEASLLCAKSLSCYCHSRSVFINYSKPGGRGEVIYSEAALLDSALFVYYDLHASLPPNY